MEFPWLQSGLCRRTRDRLLDRLSAPVPGEAPGSSARGSSALASLSAPSALQAALQVEMQRHIDSCSSCRTLAAAVPAVEQWGRHWSPAEPPPGLAEQTALRLQPFWTVRERAVNRQEVRMIWSSGLALAATTALAFLLVLDGIFPISAAAERHPLVQVGLLLGVTQLIGGGLLSLTLLALDLRRRHNLRVAAIRTGGASHSPATGPEEEGGQAR